jgi:hypothetical protein
LELILSLFLKCSIEIVQIVMIKWTASPSLSLTYIIVSPSEAPCWSLLLHISFPEIVTVLSSVLIILLLFCMMAPFPIKIIV